MSERGPAIPPPTPPSGVALIPSPVPYSSRRIKAFDAARSIDAAVLMKFVLGVMAGASLLASVYVFFTAKSAVHEILAGIMLVCFVVCASGLVIVEQLARLVAALEGK